MTEQDLQNLYGRWTGQLNVWTAKRLGRHIDCQFFAQDWTFRLYSGYAQAGDIYAFHTVPRVVRPAGERAEMIQLPRPADNPSPEELDRIFQRLCFAAARVLEIDLGKPKLAEPKQETHELHERELPPQTHHPKHALPARKRGWWRRIGRGPKSQRLPPSDPSAGPGD